MARTSAAARSRPPESSPPEPAEIRVPAELREAVAYRLRLAQETAFAAYRARVGGSDFRPGRYSWLMLVRDNPGTTPTALARALGRDKSTVTAALRDLEARGLVSRQGNDEDRRSYGVSLTAAGGRLLAQLRHHAEAHDRAVDAVVGPDKAWLLAILDRLARALAADTPPAAGAGD